MQTINIANHFSRYPAGRIPSDGPYSGELFRDNFLVPVLKTNEKVIIEMDGTRGYGSSFLEEAFGGLIRLGFTEEQVLSAFQFISSDPSLIEEIQDYIKHGADQHREMY